MMVWSFGDDMVWYDDDMVWYGDVGVPCKPSLPCLLISISLEPRDLSL